MEQMRARADTTAENQLEELSGGVKDGEELPRHRESKSEFTVSLLSALGVQRAGY